MGCNGAACCTMLSRTSGFATANLLHELSAMGEPQDTPPPTVEQIFTEHMPKVYKLARHMLGNDADAEDVAQDVLLQVVRKLPSFRGEADIGTWLHRITVNAALDHRARRARREQHQAEGPLDEHLEDGDDRP